jgi:hypothetical protein
MKYAHVPIWKKELDHMRITCDSFDTLSAWINDHLWDIMQHVCGSIGRDLCLKGNIPSVCFQHMRFSHHYSNSHSAPLVGVTNWHRVNHLPKGYPAWHGVIEIAESRSYPGGYYDLFRHIKVYTAGGGYGTYSVVLWDSDWPGIRVTQSLLNS